MTSEDIKNVDSGLYLERGVGGKHCRVYQTQNIFIWTFLSERGYIKAFYRLNFRLQTVRLQGYSDKSNRLLPDPVCKLFVLYCIELYCSVYQINTRGIQYVMKSLS